MNIILAALYPSSQGLIIGSTIIMNASDAEINLCHQILYWWIYPLMWFVVRSISIINYSQASKMLAWGAEGLCREWPTHPARRFYSSIHRILYHYCMLPWRWILYITLPDLETKYYDKCHGTLAKYVPHVLSWFYFLYSNFQVSFVGHQYCVLDMLGARVSNETRNLLPD